MKNLLLVALCAIAPFLSNAQLTTATVFSNDTFRIQKFPARYWFRAEKIRKPKRMESILLAKKDLQINRDWQASKTTRAVGTGVMALGIVLEAVGLAQQIKGDEGGINLVLSGTGVLLGGVIIQLLGNAPTKRAVLRYNDLEMKRAAVFVKPDHGTKRPVEHARTASDSIKTNADPSAKKKCDPDAPGPRITLRAGLNASKLWEIGGSKELQTDEKIWWAKSMPIAIAYEVPGSIEFELALLSKGFRVKTETTNTGGTTKSRTDLQFRFLQLSTLKKLPIGSQDRRLRLHAQGGVFIGYAMGARSKFRSVTKNDDTKQWTRRISKLEFGDDFNQLNANRFDAGLLGGVGVSYPVWCGRITFDARFSVGAMNLEKTKSDNPEYKLPSLHTRDLALLVGYSVPLSR